MCGIAGFFDASLEEGRRQQVIGNMLEAIAHRGPDARDTRTYGALTLGHNRLSIIDLSEEANQPMERDGYSLIFNGEVYNYVEIREELRALGRRFETSSDTEVVLAAYLEWGEACVEKFVGMWAFALWDEPRQKLFCSRDRFGIKPFYYIRQGARLYFASEAKALQPCPLFSSALNPSQVARYLQLGWMSYREETFFSDVHQLPAAHNLIWQDGHLEIRPYWDIPAGRQTGISFPEAREMFRERFYDSIRLHLRSDVEVGGCLSGGIDSSSIVSVVGATHPELAFHTFTIYYEGQRGMDERSFARQVGAKYPNLIAHEYQPQEEDIAARFAHFLWAQDFPPAGSSPFSQYFVMQLARQHGMKVMLDGQGSDEYLIGYLRSFYRLIGQALPGLGAFSIWKDHVRREGYSLSEAAKRFGKGAASWIMDEQALAELEYRHLLPFMPLDRQAPFALARDGRDKVDNFLYHLLFHTELPSLLHYEDRNSMAFSIESRVPFLDHRLVELAFSLPTDYKAHRGITKHILRESLREALPEAIYARKDKKGFVSPGEVQWLRGPLRFLLDLPFEPIEGFDTRKANQIIERYKQGDNSQAKLIWRLALLNYWRTKPSAS